MSGRLSDRTRMHHNALIVAPRTSRRPLTAGEMVPRLPWTDTTVQHPRHDRCKNLPDAGRDCGRVMECDGTAHVLQVRPAGYHVYAYLTALERDGVVCRAAGSGHGRRIVWELTERGAAAEEIDNLRRIANIAAPSESCPPPGAGTTRPAGQTATDGALNDLLEAAISAEVAAEKELHTAADERRHAEDRLYALRERRAQLEAIKNAATAQHDTRESR